MFDKLQIYKGDDIPINSKIIIKQPTLGQIVDFGEQKYFNAIHTLISVGADMKWQLDEKGIDYTKIDDYDLFLQLIYKAVGSHKQEILEAQQSQEGVELLQQFSQEQIEQMLINPLELVLNIDFGDFKVYQDKKTEEIILYNKEKDIIVDRAIYSQIVNIIRQIHGYKRNNEMPANDFTKRCLIEDAKNEALAMSSKPYQSYLRPLVSYMKILNNQCGTKQIWDMKINEFFYDLKKSNKMFEAKLLLQGAYSGFANLKGIDTQKLDMLADVNDF